MSKVAIVTGANKGIGLHIVRGLCQEFDGEVYLTARDQSRGLAAVELLKNEGLYPKFHQLDITDEKSIITFKDFINETYGGWDILINNAGVAVKVTDPYSRQEEIDHTFQTNYFGCINVCNYLLPTVRNGARLVHVSSGSGAIAYQFCDKELQKRISSIRKLEEVTYLMNTYISTGKLEMEGKLGWPDSTDTFGYDTKPWPYGISKIGMTLHAALLHEVLDAHYNDVIVNACSPGNCATDMTSNKGIKPAHEGAKIPLSLALIPPNEKYPKGKFKGGDGKIPDDLFNIDISFLYQKKT